MSSSQSSGRDSGQSDQTGQEGAYARAWLYLDPLGTTQMLTNGDAATSDSLLEFLTTPGIDTDPSGYIARYKEVAGYARTLRSAPADTRILNKLVWPMRHAIGGYITGNYLGTISLCGTVAEMMAILMYDLSNSPDGQTPLISEEEEKLLYGSTFEKLGQDRRIKVLRAHGMIDEGARAAMELIKNTRRKYLHLWSQDHDSIASDAVKCFKAALGLVMGLIRQDLHNGAADFDPRLTDYLLRTGTVDSEMTSDPPEKPPLS